LLNGFIALVLLNGKERKWKGRQQKLRDEKIERMQQEGARTMGVSRKGELGNATEGNERERE